MGGIDKLISIELSSKIKNIDPSAKIIAVTADTSSSTIEKLDKLKIGMIQKPFKMDQDTFKFSIYWIYLRCLS